MKLQEKKDQEKREKCQIEAKKSEQEVEKLREELVSLSNALDGLKNEELKHIKDFGQATKENEQLRVELEVQTAKAHSCNS